MFPEADDPDAAASEPKMRFGIALDISFDFESPKITICLWKMPTAWAAVPETSVYEDGQPKGTEIKVRMPRQVGWVKTPAGNR
ncbi:MAG: hypothetical protein WA252_03025 [Candidatus Sulfotelmatobacter sp.]